MSDSIDYDRQITIKGDVDKALELSLQNFVNAGFRIVSHDASGHELDSDGPINSRQNPLAMISRVLVQRSGNDIRLRASFGGVRKLKQFMVLLIGGLAIVFVILFGVLFAGSGSGFRLWMVILPLAPWVFLIPLMNRLFARRVTRTLDTLLDNLQALAG